MTHFVPFEEAADALECLPAGSLAAFDEAQYWGPEIVSHWLAASERGVDVIVATPSPAQLAKLAGHGVTPTELSMQCDLCLGSAETSIRLPARESTLALCSRCHESVVASVRKEVVSRLRRQGPHPGEKSLYQPVELAECNGWSVIRDDCERRADIVAAAAREVIPDDHSRSRPTYLDVGCNTGYLCHLMRRRGFQAIGVDLVEGDIAVAQILDTFIRRDHTVWVQADAYDYLSTTRDDKVDVASAFSVFQWVMMQKSPERGIECIELLFEKTRSVCVLEMGDWREAHYRDRLGIEIDTAWTESIMRERGDFSEVRVFEAAEHKIKRDLVVGLRRPRAALHPSHGETRGQILVRASRDEGERELSAPSDVPTEPRPGREVRLLGQTDDAFDFVEPAEALAEWRQGMPAASVETLNESEARGVRTTEVRFLTGTHEGRPVYMHGYLCRPQRQDALPPTLLIPGGGGKFAPELPTWQAQQTGACVLSVDWIGVGGSTDIGLFPPAAHVFRFASHDIRTSYQYYNVRALLQALDVLVAQPGVDGSKLSVMGSSWGGFYSLLLGGLDSRIANIHATFGCGFLELGCHQIWESHLQTMDADDVELWRKWFDPGRRAHLIESDVFFVEATNDRYFGLPAAMRTYHRIRSRKRLLLVRNQDHSAQPYHRLGIEVARAQSQGAFPAVLPQVAAAWEPGTATVEVSVEAPSAIADVRVQYSAGEYAPWSARLWRSVRAHRSGDRWLADLPVVDPERELWFYGHVDCVDGTASSSPVLDARPVDLGVTRATSTFVPGYDFGAESWWDLPVGDVGNPRLSLVREDGASALSVSFAEGDHLRGVAYCLEGDLIDREGFDALDALVQVPRPEDVAGLKLGVFTDYGTLDEQAYAVDVAQLGSDFSRPTRVRLRFAELTPVPHRKYPLVDPPAKPLRRERLCAIGFVRSSVDFKGEGMLADVKLVRIQPATPRNVNPEGDGTSAESPYTLTVETSMSPQQLRAELARWQPWRHEIEFSNGVRTSEFAQGKMFAARPLEKWHDFASRIPESALRGGRVLDVGSNIGHYAIFLRRAFDLTVTGLETNPRNLEVARFLVDTAGLDRIDFVDADASFWRDGSDFDLILHLGTLDHLRHPLLALENAAAMLRDDGYFALELQTLVADDDLACRFVGDTDRETTCCWFLGRGALFRMLEESGFDRVEVLRDWRKPELIGDDMARLVVLARKRRD